MLVSISVVLFLLIGSRLFTVAIGFERNNKGMMHQSINGSHGHHVISEDMVPLTEVLIGSDQKTFSFIAMSNQFKKDGGFSFRLFDIAKIIDNQELAIHPKKNNLKD